MSEKILVGPDSTTFETEAAGRKIAVLGVGAFEQHSYHLPLDTDFFFAGRIGCEVARAVDAFYLSPLPYSVSISHRGFAGTVYLRPETLMRVVRDIAESVGEWGIRYLAVLNFHGGNFVLNPTVHEWNMDGRTPKIMDVEIYNGLSDMAPNLHACEVETSMMLYLAPERVRMDLRQDFVPSQGREDITHFGVKVLSPHGVWGYPTRATPEKGRRWFEEAVGYGTRRIGELTRGFEQEPAKPETGRG